MGAGLLRIVKRSICICTFYKFTITCQRIVFDNNLKLVLPCIHTTVDVSVYESPQTASHLKVVWNFDDLGRPTRAENTNCV